MSFWKKKKTEFIAAVCPKCGGNLEMDTNLKTAYCQQCGAHCLIENAPKSKKTTTLQTVISFFEREQDLKKKEKSQNPTMMQTVINFVEKQQEQRRKDKEAERLRKIEEKRRDDIATRKILIGCGIVLAVIFVFVVIMAGLE